MTKLRKDPVLRESQVCIATSGRRPRFGMNESSGTLSGQLQQRVKHLMNRQKTQLKAKGQKMPSHSELKKPEQIIKKRVEKGRRESLQRARQARKSGRTNYKNKKQSGKAKHSRKAPPKKPVGGAKKR